MQRRSFLATSAAVFGYARVAGASPSRPADDLDAFIIAKMARDHIPGVVAALIRGQEIAWSNSYGFADLERRIPMSLDTIQNIASISKTFTTAALIQQVEAGQFSLDDDIQRHLPFPVRNPAHPDAPITIRQLLTHRSSIRDGSAYSRRYACGDPSLPLADWLRGYFTPGHADYSAKENFHAWAPGGGWDYCNLAYGLAAHLVEVATGTDFERYCRERLFGPLGMTDTSWYLRNVDQSRHAVPYTFVGGGEARGPAWGGTAQGVIRPAGAPPPQAIEGFQANCRYNHPNFPDGFLRTSVRQLARWALCHLSGGTVSGTGARILDQRSVQALLTVQRVEGRRSQGLTWYATTTVRGQLAWGHGGSDPGVNTHLHLLPTEGIGSIVFLNTNGARPEEITERILSVAPTL